MPQALALWCCLVGVAAVPAQAAAALAAAQAHADAGEDAAALERLAGLSTAALSEAEHRQADRLLIGLGQRFRAAGDLERSARAHAAALAHRIALHGDTHRSVADSASETATVLLQLGRARDALPHFEQALRVHRQLRGDVDHVDVARAENNVAFALSQLDRLPEALPHAERALAICRRLAGDRDDPGVAHCLDTVGNCLRLANRADAALPLFEESLAMRRRLAGDANHPTVERALNNLAVCLRELARYDDALARLDESLAMHRQLHADADSSELATSLGNRASLLTTLGRAAEALPAYEQALAVRRRLLADADHPLLANDLANLAYCLDILGQADVALPLHEQALAIRRRLAEGNDDRNVAMSLNNVASCLQCLGRHDEALPAYEAAAAMLQRLAGDRPDPRLALFWNNLAYCLFDLGRADEALPLHRQALAMQRQVHEGDHPDVAQSLHNIGSVLSNAGDHAGAREPLEQAFSMRRRLFGERDHPDIATSLQLLGALSLAENDGEAAIAQLAAALAMRRRMYGDTDHPHLVVALASVGACLVHLDRWQEAAAVYGEACSRIERLRERGRVGGGQRQSLFDELKRTGPFERLQQIQLHLGDVDGAFATAERSRARELLDLCEQQRFDPLDEARRRAELRGDTATAAAIGNLRAALAAADSACDVALHTVTQLDDGTAAAPARAAAMARLEQTHTERRRLLDERARLCADVLPVGRVGSPAALRDCLGAGEALLEFTLDGSGSVAYLATRERIEAFPLPDATQVVRDHLSRALSWLSHPGAADARGRDPGEVATTAGGARACGALFAALVPAPLWTRLRQLDTVHVAAHRELHRLPFEALVTGSGPDGPVHWLDEGPAIAYVPSGSMLRWLRDRAQAANDDATHLDLLAVGDPSAVPEADGPMPNGALVLAVDPQGNGARAGLRAHDVVTAYDAQPVTDDRSLRDLRAATSAAIEDGIRADGPIRLAIWRHGESIELTIANGTMGIEVARGSASTARPGDRGLQRTGSIQDLGKLPPLAGARAEADAVASLFADHGLRAVKLLGSTATEPAVFEHAAQAKYVHFACHGIAEEYAGQSFSLLLLARPITPLPGDDGLLQLRELLGPWRGRLASSRLVVLSACRTNVGPTLRDEAPQALPIGLMFAGAASVVSSLWAVDDASTRELMTDFYRRLLADGAGRLPALHAAKRALRERHRHPYHWAPFCFLGSTD
ncbi:MAG: tetratricopeptide repeat protein [Planctomycetes bacterium]|nr:tetratricopeptide repeat protein [Planctomycetota bacterium]